MALSQEAILKYEKSR